MKLLIHSHLASWELGNCCQWISNFIPHFLCWACKYLSTRGLKLFLVSKRASSDPFYSHGLTWIPAWISNHMPSIVWDEITYPLINFNGTIVEVKEWIRNLLVGFYLWDYKMALSDAATGPKVNSKSWFNIKMVFIGIPHSKKKKDIHEIYNVKMTAYILTAIYWITLLVNATHSEAILGQFWHNTVCCWVLPKSWKLKQMDPAPVTWSATNETGSSKTLIQHFLR